MTWDEWEDTYLPTTPLAMDNLRDVPRGIPNERIWTMIDGDGRFANLVNGIHFFNRLGYFVTDIPWTEDVFVTNQKDI